MIDISGLEDKKALVTGATGFIGGRLAERLAREAGARVTGTGRDLEKAAALEGLGVRLRRADLLDFRRMRELVEGQEVVFHVAAWLSRRHGNDEMAWPLNVFATLELVRAAATAGVSRLVHVSSIAAYGPPEGPVMDEGRPVDPAQSAAYGATKAEGEQRALVLAGELGLALSVVRPGMVYGPGSYGWSVRMLRLVQRGVPLIFGKGDGHAHPVYVDNLVDGMMLAATRPEAAGKAFNFVDEPVTWREWFGAYGAMAGREPVALPFWLARLGFVVAAHLPLGLSIRVSDRLLGYYTSKTVYPTAKAERLLGYGARVGFEEGMRRTEAWLREEGHL